MKLKWWERFKIIPSGCWEWLGGRTSAGYGMANVDGQQQYTHRLFYQRFKGPIPKGLVIDHLCRNVGCCNPSHLEAVTSKVNCLRAPASQIALNSNKSTCINGHEFTLGNTFVYQGQYGPKRQCRECKRLRQLQYTRRKKRLMTA